MLCNEVCCAKFDATNKIIFDGFICCFKIQSLIIVSQLGYCFTDIEVSLTHIATDRKKIEVVKKLGELK